MKEAVLIALFLSVLVINGVIGEYSIEELIEKLKSLAEFKDNQIAEDYFYHYKNRQILMKTPTENIPISLNQKYKLLFLSLTFLH